MLGLGKFTLLAVCVVVFGLFAKLLLTASYEAAKLRSISALYSPRSVASRSAASPGSVVVISGTLSASAPQGLADLAWAANAFRVDFNVKQKRKMRWISHEDQKFVSNDARIDDWSLSPQLLMQAKEGFERIALDTADDIPSHLAQRNPSIKGGDIYFDEEGRRLRIVVLGWPANASYTALGVVDKTGTTLEPISDRIVRNFGLLIPGQYTGDSLIPYAIGTRQMDAAIFVVIATTVLFLFLLQLSRRFERNSWDDALVPSLWRTVILCVPGPVLAILPVALDTWTWLVQAFAGYVVGAAVIVGAAIVNGRRRHGV